MCGSERSATRVIVPSVADAEDLTAVRIVDPQRARLRLDDDRVAAQHQDRSRRGSPPPGSPAPTPTDRRPTRRCRHRRPGRCRSGCRQAVAGPTTVDADVQLAVEVGDVLGAEHVARRPSIVEGSPVTSAVGQPESSMLTTAAVVPPVQRPDDRVRRRVLGRRRRAPTPGQRDDKVARVVPREPPRVGQRRWRPASAGRRGGGTYRWLLRPPR